MTSKAQPAAARRAEAEADDDLDCSNCLDLIVGLFDDAHGRRTAILDYIAKLQYFEAAQTFIYLGLATATPDKIKANMSKRAALVREAFERLTVAQRAHEADESK